MGTYWISCQDCSWDRKVEGLDSAKNKLWDHSDNNDHAVKVHGIMA
jgi:Zn-finger protein